MLSSGGLHSFLARAPSECIPCVVPLTELRDVFLSEVGYESYRFRRWALFQAQDVGTMSSITFRELVGVGTPREIVPEKASWVSSKDRIRKERMSLIISTKSRLHPRNNINYLSSARI